MERDLSRRESPISLREQLICSLELSLRGGGAPHPHTSAAYQRDLRIRICPRKRSSYARKRSSYAYVDVNKVVLIGERDTRRSRHRDISRSHR